MKKLFFIFLLFYSISFMPLWANSSLLVSPIKSESLSSDKNDEQHLQNTLIYLNLDWWQNYNDDILINHLKKLFEENYDLKNAQLKIKENEYLIKMQLADELPSLSFDGLISRDFRSSVLRYGDMAIPNFAQNNFQLPLTMSYEVDIWGKNRLKTKVKKEQFEISKQIERALYIKLTSDFTAQYYNLIKTDKLLSIQNELINLQKEIISKLQDKFKIGLCKIDDVLIEEKLLTTLNEEKNNLEETKEVLINTLKIYLAQSEGNIERISFEDITIPQNLPNEINSEVIDNRPDYIIQESNLRKTGFDVKIAKKELLPSFIVFGQIGLNAYQLSHLFNRSSQLANAGIMPSFDLFSGGKKLAFLKFKKYQYDEALNNYHKTILEDIKELNLGLLSYKTALSNYNESVERLNHQSKLFAMQKERNNIGVVSNLDILYNREAELLIEKKKS